MLGALTWNLFHGRDFPPDSGLLTWRSRILGVTERGRTHAQVNRPLRTEFAQLIAAMEWDVALLQEAPPRWLRPLARAARASGASVLTSRNLGSALRALLAELNPDLIASNEGGSNQLLVRSPWRIAAVRRMELTRRPERRAMIWALLERPTGGSLAVANLHASTNPAQAAPELLDAAERAVEWAGDAPLLFGGDFNVRPRRTPEVFAELRSRFGLEGATGPDAIDHLLVRGLEVREPPRALAADARELLAADGTAIRLSDHAPVVAALAMR